MDSAPEIDTVHRAVITLYHNPDPVEKDKASRWLGDLQKSVYSWKVADELLQEKRDLESCYFAAQTMRTKIQYSFHELPCDAHTSLRDALLNHLEQVNDSTNTVIVTQLCLALAGLTLQMSSWQKPVLDLIARFGDRSLWPLLDVLTVLPEEMNSRSLRLGANRRHQILVELFSCSGTVCEFLKACWSSSGDNPNICIRILRCFSSWIAVQAISLQDVTDNVIVAQAFNVLSNHQSSTQIHDSATELVCSLLQCLENNNNQPDLEQRLFTGVVALEQCYHLSVAHEDQEKSINYCRIFSELAESFLDKIISSSSCNKTHFALKAFDLVLMCVGHHDYEVAEITFNLWYRLSEDLYSKNDEQLTSVYKPYVERLIASLCRHSRMEPDHEGLLEDGDDFADFRMKVSELIKDVVFIVGSSNCFRQMFISLQEPGVTWDSSEAALFVMQAVAKNIIPEENDVVPKVIEAILQLPENTHIAVRHTSVLLLGELCEWIERHPESLDPVLNFLLFCLQQSQLASAAANSLQSICTSCRANMAQHFNGLVQLVQALDSFSISNEAATGLLKGVSVILAKMPPNEIHEAMKRICWAQINPLCHIMENDLKIERGTKTDPAVWLDRLSAIFRHTNPRLESGEVHPCSGVLTEIWPVLSQTCNKFQADCRIMERYCRCIRFAVRCVGKQSATLLEPLVKQMVSLYSMYKHSCFLYLGSILVDVYACEPQCVNGLLDMLHSFIQPTFDILQEDNGLKNHPDTVDDFFRLCARFLQRSAVSFLQCSALRAILQCAVMASSLDHKDANASVMKFFYDLIYCGRCNKDSDDIELRRTLVSSIVAEHGHTLVSHLIQASVFSLHSYMLVHVADVIMELMDADRNAMCKWLEEALQSLPTHNSAGAVTATQSQMQDFHQALCRAQSCKEVTSLLSDFAKLYH